MPTDATDSSAIAADFSEALAIGLYYYSGTTRTADAGQAAGTVVDAVLTYQNIYDSLGKAIACKNNTSLSFTCDALTTEVDADAKPGLKKILEASDYETPAAKAAAVGAELSNGEYVVDYKRGMLWAKKATTTASMTSVSYKISVVASDSSGTVPSSSSSSSSSAGGGNNNYSTEEQDFTATVTDSTNDIVLSVDSVGGQSITAANFVNGTLKVTKASDNSVVTIALDNIDWTSATKTLDTSGCTGAFTFATGDVVSLTIKGPDKTRDYSADAQKTVEQAPVWSHTAGDTLASVTNEADATSYYYLDVEGYEYAGIMIEKTGGTDTVAFTIEATPQNDGTAESSCTYHDITQYGTECLTAAAGASFADDVSFRIPTKGLKFIRVKVAVTLSANDVDYVIYAQRA